jgi:hypothetical protein
MKKILGVNKNVFYLSLVSLFNDFSNEMIYSVMPAFSYGFCQLFGGAFGGFIWSKFNFGFAFLLGAILISISYIILVLSLKKQ